jgi:hypothetical protein
MVAGVVVVVVVVVVMLMMQMLMLMLMLFLLSYQYRFENSETTYAADAAVRYLRVASPSPDLLRRDLSKLT